MKALPLGQTTAAAGEQICRFDRRGERRELGGKDAAGPFPRGYRRITVSIVTFEGVHEAIIDATQAANHQAVVRADHGAAINAVMGHAVGLVAVNVVTIVYIVHLAVVCAALSAKSQTMRPADSLAVGEGTWTLLVVAATRAQRHQPLG